MTIPPEPKIYHIVHIDRLLPILATGGLLSDAEIRSRQLGGTEIGDAGIKDWRLKRTLTSHVGLNVGDYVPFYFAPRSPLLYFNHIGRQGIPNREGQRPIIHLEADLYEAIEWADSCDLRWAFTDANAAKLSTNDFNDLRELHRIPWDVVSARNWEGQADAKMAEFLVEGMFAWSVIKNIGVFSEVVARRVRNALANREYNSSVEIRRYWYY